VGWWTIAPRARGVMRGHGALHSRDVSGYPGGGDILFEASCISGDNRVEGWPTPLSSWIVL
jgi:hypothetical protein